MSYKKGARRERELLEEFYEEGYVGFRAPSSGSTTDRELPDVIVGNSGKTISIEAKGSGGETKYISKKEVEDLIYFADQFGSEYYIAVRFDYCDWVFMGEEEMHETEKSYRIKKENIDKGERISEIV